jgi:ribosomal protein S18 acetylase RimI-like enzyme
MFVVKLRTGIMMQSNVHFSSSTLPDLPGVNTEAILALHRSCFHALSSSTYYSDVRNELIAQLESGSVLSISSSTRDLLGFISWSVVTGSVATDEYVSSRLQMALADDPDYRERCREYYKRYAMEIGARDTFVNFFPEHLESLTASTTDSDGYIENICVDPSVRRTGFGVRLIKVCEDRLAQNGVRRIFTSALLSGGSFELFLQSGYRPLVTMCPVHDSGAGSAFMVKSIG